MVAMAKQGQGNPYYGETAADLFEPFAEEFDLIASLCARRLRLSLSAPAGVTMTLRNDYPVEEREGFPAILLPDLALGAEAWTLVDLDVAAGIASMPAASCCRRASPALRRMECRLPSPTPRSHSRPCCRQRGIAAARPARSGTPGRDRGCGTAGQRACGGRARRLAGHRADARRGAPALRCASMGDPSARTHGHAGAVDECAGFRKAAMYASTRMSSRLSAKDEALGASPPSPRR